MQCVATLRWKPCDDTCGRSLSLGHVTQDFSPSPWRCLSAPRRPGRPLQSPIDIMAAIDGCDKVSKACAFLCPRLPPGCPRYARADPRTGGSDSGPARRPLVAGQHVRQTLTNFRTCLLQTGAKVCLTFGAPLRQVWDGCGGSDTRGHGKGGGERATGARTTLHGMRVAPLEASSKNVPAPPATQVEYHRGRAPCGPW